MRKRKTSKSMIATPRELDKLIEEATVDCYNEEEQASGLFTVIDENLALPFSTQVLGVEVAVVAVEMDDDSSLKAVCERGGNRQRIGLTDLPLPSSQPSGAEWIAAYRRCCTAGGTTSTRTNRARWLPHLGVSWQTGPTPPSCRMRTERAS